MIYRFENAELDTLAFELTVGGEQVRLEPQVFEVLRYLVERHGQLCQRTELLDAIWGDQFVSDSALSSRVATARKVLGDDGRSQRLIRTVHGRGFRFIGEVTEHETPGPAPLLDLPSLPAQSVRLTNAPDGHRLAVASVGSGTPLVKAANWLTHLEYDWESPVWNHWMNELSARFRFVRYDARGCGLSGRDVSSSDLTDLNLWTTDLECIVESADIERCVLLGVSAGAAPAMDFASRHPEKVSHLILYGGYLQGMRRRGPESERQADVFTHLIEQAWGTENPAFRAVFTTSVMPDATAEHMRWFNELQAKTADAAAALALETAFYRQDFTQIAKRVSVPTLVLHCRGDLATPYEQGLALAEAIPGAEFVTLDSRNHALRGDEPAWRVFLDHLDRFVAQ